MRILLIASVFMFSCGDKEKACPKKTCSDFSTQKEAQAAFNSDKDCYKSLDGDNDGIGV